VSGARLDRWRGKSRVRLLLAALDSTADADESDGHDQNECDAHGEAKYRSSLPVTVKLFRSDRSDRSDRSIRWESFERTQLRCCG
jgi:hypothetical protein